MKQLKKLVARTVRKARQSDAADRRQGDTARERGDWSAAAAAYRRHVERNPQDFDIWVQLGHALKESGRYDQAEGAYQQAHRLNGANADLFLSRGHLAKLVGDTRSAVDFYNRSFLVDGNPEAARELAQKTFLTAQAASPPPLLQLVGALEKFEDGVLSGWIVNPDDPHRPAEVEILEEDKVIAVATGLIDRPDLRRSGASARPSGFQVNLRGRIDLASQPRLYARLRATGEALAGSPLIASVSEAAQQWMARNDNLSKVGLAALKDRIRSEANGARLSLVVPMHRAEKGELNRLVDSLMAQWSEEWELLLVHAPAPDADLEKRLARCASRDSRIKVLAAAEEGRTAEIVAGCAAATGDYVAAIRPSTVLEPEAVFRILDAGQEKPGLIYWDEAVCSHGPESIERFINRPAFSFDHLLAFPALLGEVAARRDLAIAASRKAATSDGGDADLEFTLSCVESGDDVVHIPAALTRTKPSIELQGEQHSAKVHRTLENYLRRSRSAATVSEGSRPGAWTITATPHDGRRLIVVIGAGDLSQLKHCVDATLRTTLRSHDDVLVVMHSDDASKTCRDYLAAMEGHIRTLTVPGGEILSSRVNAYVVETGDTYDHVALLADHVQPKAGGWLDRLCAIAVRPDVGAVSPILVDRSGLVQSAGLARGEGKLRRRSHDALLKAAKSRTRGQNDTLLALHNASAASDCIVMRRDLFLAAGGLDSTMPIDLGSIDFCLRISRTGRQILVDPQTVLGSTTLAPVVLPYGAFRVRWAGWLGGADLHAPTPVPVASVSDIDHYEAWPARVRPARPTPAAPELAKHRLIPAADSDFHQAAI